MKHGLGAWISFPVFLVLLVFPIGTFCMFRLTSDWYVSRESKKRVEHAIDFVRREAEEVAGFRTDGADLSQEMAQSSAAEMLKRIRKRMKKQPAHVAILVFDTRLETVYASFSAIQTGTDPLAQEWRQLLEDGSLLPGQITRVEIKGDPYVAELYEVKTDRRIRGKYFIVYERIADVSRLLLETGGLLLLITTLLFSLSAAAAWAIARRIERPVKELCSYTQMMGKGYGELAQKRYEIRELEQLRTSFVDMEKRLKESQKEKEQIFQGISHDLRTPLVSIIGYADGIQRGIMPDPGKAAGIILEESQRMERMVEDLLTLSKLDSNSWSDKKVRLPLEEFLEEETEILQGMAVENGKEIVFLGMGKEEASDGRHAGKTCRIEADTGLLTRVFQNVASNCLRYAERQVKVRIDSFDGWAKVFVEDDGPGIEETEAAYIFERDHCGKKGQFGLGLAMAKSGMEHLGGTIEVENKKPPEKGAIFCLCFPLLAEERMDGWGKEQ